MHLLLHLSSTIFLLYFFLLFFWNMYGMHFIKERPKWYRSKLASMYFIFITKLLCIGSYENNIILKDYGILTSFSFWTPGILIVKRGFWWVSKGIPTILQIWKLSSKICFFFLIICHSVFKKAFPLVHVYCFYSSL